MADTPEQTATRWWHRPALSLAPLRTRGFRYLFLAESISEFGNGFHVVGLPWLVYTLGGDNRQLGLVVAAYGLCRLVTTPLGGLCTDRFGAWRVMMVSDLARGLLSVVLAVLAVTGPPGTARLVLIGALAGALGLFAGLFQPAAWAITPTLLPAEQLTAGMALNSTVTFAAGLAGPGVAGLLVVATGPAVAFAVDAATFLVSAGFLAAIGAGLRDRATPPRGSGVPRGFFALLRQSPLLRNVLVVTVVANLTFGGMSRVALPALAAEDFSSGAIGLGALVATFTAGCLVGGLVAAGLTGVTRRGAVAMGSGVVMALSVLIVPLAGIAGALVFLFLAGAASTVTNVMIVTVVQRGTPTELLGRTMSAIVFCALGLFPVSVAATGFVTDRFGPTTVFLATGALLLLAFAFGLTRKEITSR
ncbi:MFS transporter [Lentzea sp. NPDC004789]